MGLELPSWAGETHAEPDDAVISMVSPDMVDIVRVFHYSQLPSPLVSKPVGP